MEFQEDMQRLVVFDVGGVLVELTGMSDLVEWTGLNPDEVRDRWVHLDVVKSFESGAISYEEFGPKVIAELGLPLTVDTFREVFRGWMGELLPGAEALVAAAKRRNPVACLCNMNTVQWPEIRDRLGVESWFDHAFISYEIGMVKPDKEVYEHVGQRMGFSPERVVFFDDTRANVDSALACGWSAHLTRGTGELRRKLVALDLV